MPSSRPESPIQKAVHIFTEKSSKMPSPRPESPIQKAVHMFSEKSSLPPHLRVRHIMDNYHKKKKNEQKDKQVSIFTEMAEFSCKNNPDGEWEETARWIKFEENVEDGGFRWTKPFVGTISLHALFDVRSCVLNGTLLLDVSVTSVNDLVELIVEDMFDKHLLTYGQKLKVWKALLRPHRHLYEMEKKVPLLIINKTGGKLDPSNPAGNSKNKKNWTEDDFSQFKKGNTEYKNKIPKGSEVANVLVGEFDFLTKPVSALVRLATPTQLGDFTEVPLPTRFIFLMLGPKGDLVSYRETGRVIANMMSDCVFQSLAYGASNRHHLLAGIDEFMDSVTVLPPGEWDPSIRLEPPPQIPCQEPRKDPGKKKEWVDPTIEELKFLKEQGLVRTGRLFGGLIDDIKRKAPWYVSDFTDGFSTQCIASIAFLYFASLSPIITFGGLLGDATENRLAALESLLAGCICGLIYSLFSGQPLALLNATGPVLVFETILYGVCKDNGFDYLSVRLWVGLWIGIFLIVMCAFELSAWVSYITPFTEENFALLIASIYIYKAVQKVLEIGKDFPLNPPEGMDCYYLSYDNSTNETVSWIQTASNNTLAAFNNTLAGSNNNTMPLYANNETMGVYETCQPGVWYPNVFLMSVLLSLFTFFVCVTLKALKKTPYFSFAIRNTFSDFAVIIAIVSMTALDYWVGIHTPKLHVPEEFKPTWGGRGWIIYPFHPDNPWWIIPGSMLPAMLATILLFLDQQITAVIVNRKENRLKKGTGYHLDLFVLGIITILMGFLGLPWHVAGTVLCINHINSLKVETETAIPGEKRCFRGVREQRLTHFFIFLLVGLSTLMTPYLNIIPMPVLYGVFLFMGTSALGEISFFNRMRIILIPVKYQPDYDYLRQVPLKRVHLFTLIQLICFIVLWIVKSNETISISFPMMLVVIIFVRKCLDFLFTQEELRALDEVLPPSQKKKTLNANDNESNVSGPPNNLHKSECKMNISDELDKTSAWKHINYSRIPSKNPDKHEINGIGASVDEITMVAPLAEQEDTRSSGWSWNK